MRADAQATHEGRERPHAQARRWLRWLAAFALANLIAWALLWALAGPVQAQSDVHAAAPAAAFDRDGKIDLQRRLKDVRVERVDGQVFWVVDTPAGSLRLSPEAFAERMEVAHSEQRGRGWLYGLLNISTRWGLLWICVGFAGQALFTLRMLLQWWASEREKRSVIPVGFWWGSLFGGLMLFVYFIWRKDIVGIVGQSTGVFVYTRNLVLIYRTRAAEHSKPAAEARTA